MNRRELFKAFVPSSKRERFLPRPPGSKNDFTSCKECDAPCIRECETGVLVRDEEGAPYLLFERSGCSFCGVCAQVCPKGVISEGSSTIRAKIVINPNICSAWKGVLCFSCKEPCLDNAIRFEGLYKPVVVSERCTACGFCVSHCPTGAIEVRANVS